MFKSNWLLFGIHSSLLSAFAVSDPCNNCKKYIFSFSVCRLKLKITTKLCSITHGALQTLCGLFSLSLSDDLMTCAEIRCCNLSFYLWVLQGRQTSIFRFQQQLQWRHVPRGHTGETGVLPGETKLHGEVRFTCVNETQLPLLDCWNLQYEELIAEK